MDNNVICKFSTVRERDMDLLFLEAMASDHEFMRLFVDETSYAGKKFCVKDIELSRTDADLGESDITVKLSFDDVTCGFLIEDKIDAIAMPEQHRRYKRRGDKGIEQGDFQTYEIFILCPEKYHETNSEAKKYEHFVSYERCRDYFQRSESVINRIRLQQIDQALEHSRKPPEVISNEYAIAFNKKYHEYQKLYYPSLNLRTSSSSNGWWEYFSTSLGRVYIYHKTQQGYVDLTFPNAASELSVLQRMAEWLRRHGMSKIMAVETGRAGALRIEVPKMNISIEDAFEKTDPAVIKGCFDTIQELSDFAGMLADGKTVAEGKIAASL